MDVLLIVNPIAGDKDKTGFVSFAKGLLKSYNLSSELYLTTGKGDIDLVKSVIDQDFPKRIIVIGGDGTLNLFLELFQHIKALIGFIPMGSANGMAEEFALDASPKALLEQFIVSKDYFEVDLLLINTRYYLLHLGDVGANASLVSNYDQDETRGFLTYAKHFWKVFNNLKSFDYEIETPENTYERKGVMLAICNGRKFGTGIPINTIGKMNDGKFELVLIKAVDFKDLIKATLSKFDDDYEIDNFEILQTTSAQIRFKEPKLLQIDGEIMGEFDYLQVEVLPKSLKFIKR